MKAHPMHRRSFLTLLGGAAAWPLAARAQQLERMRRIGWLNLGSEDDPGGQAQRTAFREALAKLGWIEGRNLRIDLHVTTGDLNRMHALAARTIRPAPDVIVTSEGAATRAVQQQTHTIPIVFAAGGDPVLGGLVQNIARPEGNITGFSNTEPSIAGKWLELLKEAVPRLARIAVIFSAEGSGGSRYRPSIEAAARASGVQAIETPVRNAIDMTRAIDTFAAEPNGGLLVLPPSPGTIRETIIPLAAQHRLPAMYPSQEDAAAGGLIAYAHDRVDQYRRAAAYVDCLLRGAKVSELPVQFPTKFALVVNLKTAKAMGLTIPEALCCARTR